MPKKILVLLAVWFLLLLLFAVVLGMDCTRDEPTPTSPVGRDESVGASACDNPETTDGLGEEFPDSLESPTEE